MLTASYLINRTPSSVLKGKTPYEMLFGVAPQNENLRTFGCLCYAHHIDRTKDKFGARSRACVFLGYPFGTKGWLVYDMDSGEIFVSRDVVFSESVFPYLTASSTDSLGVKRTNDTGHVGEETHDVRRGSVSDEPAVEHDNS